jgi:hypothetical protein
MLRHSAVIRVTWIRVAKGDVAYQSDEWHSRSVADPDPYVFGLPVSGSVSQRYRYGSGSFDHQSKIGSKKNLDSYCFVTPFGLFIFKK